MNNSDKKHGQPNNMIYALAATFGLAVLSVMIEAGIYIIEMLSRISEMISFDNTIYFLSYLTGVSFASIWMYLSLEKNKSNIKSITFFIASILLFLLTITAMPSTETLQTYSLFQVIYLTCFSVPSFCFLIFCFFRVVFSYTPKLNGPTI